MVAVLSAPLPLDADPTHLDKSEDSFSPSDVRATFIKKKFKKCG